MAETRAGTTALSQDLIDVDAVRSAYFDRVPDLEDPAQRVAFGTSGHRGRSVEGSFNERHILAITQAIVEYRNSHIRRYNPVGICALLGGTGTASQIWVYSTDPVWSGLSAYIGFVVAFVLHVTLAILTKCRPYFSDPTDPRLAVNRNAFVPEKGKSHA